MVTMVLLMIIYLAFISLGLPDALLGVTWPLIRTEWQMSLDAAGRSEGASCRERV